MECTEQGYIAFGKGCVSVVTTQLIKTTHDMVPKESKCVASGVITLYSVIGQSLKDIQMIYQLIGLIQKTTISLLTVGGQA